MKWMFIALSSFIFILSPSLRAEYNILLEGPDKEIFVGDVVELKLTLWPVSQISGLEDYFGPDPFAGSLKVLRRKSNELSENNSDALVFVFDAAILSTQTPEELSVNGKNYPLMKRTLNLKEFEPVSEQVIIFNQSLSKKDNKKFIYLFLLGCLLLVTVLLIVKLRRSKRYRLLQERKRREFVEQLTNFEGMDFVNELYRDRDKILKVYDKNSWQIEKAELDKYAFKKELSETDAKDLNIRVEKIKERIKNWNS